MKAKELSQAFLSCFKGLALRTVGSEKEIAAVHKKGGRMFRVAGPFQKHRLIGYRSEFDDINRDTVIKFSSEKYGAITFDAGSFELESKPRQTIGELLLLNQELIGKLKSILPPDVVLLAHGNQPVTRSSWELWTPKGRYRAMRQATNGAVMESCITASFQTHVSVGPAELIPALNCANKASGFMIALFANANIRGNAVDPHQAWREKVWDDFGPDYRDRTGMPAEPFRNFGHLMDYLFGLKTLFYKRRPGDWPTPLVPFSELVMELSADQAFGIWPYHMSTYWVDVRPREYGTLEFRMCCPQPMSELMSPDACALGLVENHEAISAYLNRFSWAEALELRRDAIARGLKAEIAGQALLPHLKNILYLVIDGLKRRDQGEEIFLQNTLIRLESSRPYNWADVSAEHFAEGGKDWFISKMSL